MIELTPNEARVLGVLMEKAKTTPDQYPLSLNGLTTGCNQKTNREPVLNLEETEVQELVDSLCQKSLASEVRVGGRVAKYKHRIAGTEFSAFKFNSQQQAILCLLFLRGPQTAGELRTRSGRLFNFSDIEQTEEALQELIEMPGGPFVAKLPREPGRRESRFMHLFSGSEIPENSTTPHNDVPRENPSTSSTDLTERVELLEAMVEDLEARLTQLEGKTKN